VWLSGSKQGWQPRGRWFKLNWGQSLFVGCLCKIGLCEIGDKRLGICNIIFFKQKKWMLESNFNFGSMCNLLDHTIQLLDARK
jgi:hypothetical protein